jgi:uncharacterized protein
MFKRFLILGGLFLVFAPVLVSAYENPGSPKGAVNDFAGMLTPSEVEGLEVKLDDYQKSSGNAIVIAIVNNLGGDTIENFAVQLFKDWGIGQKGKDNGVLILVSKEDRKMKIEVGYGLEGDLTDAQSYWIIRDVMMPAFQKGDYAGGLNSAADKIIGAVSGSEAVPSENLSSDSLNSGRGFGFDWFFLIFFVPIWLASILGRSKSWWAGGVLGGVAGVIIGFIKGFLYFGIISIVLLIPIGLVFDYFVSKNYMKYKSGKGKPPWWIGGMGGFGGRGGSGFGGFGGGRSGGGGASGGW